MKKKTQIDKKNKVKEKVEERSAWKFFLAFAIFVLIVFAGVFVHKLLSVHNEKKNTYNGFEFWQSAEGYWVTMIESKGQPYNIPFYHHPKELENVLVEKNIEDKILKQNINQIYISFDPDVGSVPVIGGVEIARVTGFRYNMLNIPTSSALTRAGNSSSMETVVKTCDDADNSTVVIVFEKGERDMIHSEGNCILLNYQNINSSVSVADALTYHLLGIM